MKVLDNDDATTTNKTNAVSASAMPKEKINVVVKRDSIRKEGHLNFI
jgi:hypothetical protein